LAVVVAVTLLLMEFPQTPAASALLCPYSEREKERAYV